MPTTKEIYNQVKEIDATLNKAQAEFDVADRELREIEEANPELKRANEIVEFERFKLPRKEVVFIKELYQIVNIDVGALGWGTSVEISNNRIEILNLSRCLIQNLPWTLPEGLKKLNLKSTDIRKLEQPLPEGLKELDIRGTPLASDPQYGDDLEDLKRRVAGVQGLILLSE